jgi:hypothetical protein
MAERRFHGWQAIAAIVGSLATLVTAVVAAAAFLRDDGTDQPTARPITASSGATGRASAPAGESVAVSGPEQPLHDKLRLRLSSQIEFDTDPPNSNRSGGDPDVYRFGGAFGKDINGFYGAARWTGTTDPTRAQCDLELAQATRNNIAIDVGTRLCFRTSGDRTVLVRFLKQTAEGDWQIEATVWPA